jgi:hypothetical protein
MIEKLPKDRPLPMTDPLTHLDSYMVDELAKKVKIQPGAKLEISLDNGKTFHEVQPGGRLPEPKEQLFSGSFGESGKWLGIQRTGFPGLDMKEIGVDELKPPCDCGAKPGELHFQFCPAYQPIRSDP